MQINGAIIHQFVHIIVLFAWGWHLTSKEGESYENPIINKVIEQYHNVYKGQLGRYGN